MEVSSGGDYIAFRGGRIDATQAGPPGVPEPQDTLAQHTADFARQGFTPQEMIQVSASVRVLFITDIGISLSHVATPWAEFRILHFHSPRKLQGPRTTLLATSSLIPHSPFSTTRCTFVWDGSDKC
jgi:hypothetical protein